MSENSLAVENILKERRESRDTVSWGPEATLKRTRRAVTLITLYSECDQILDDCELRLPIQNDRKEEIENTVLRTFQQQQEILKSLEEELPQVDALYFKDKVMNAGDVLMALPLYLRLRIPMYGDVFGGNSNGGDTTARQLSLDDSLAQREELTDFQPVEGIPIADQNDLSESEIDQILNSRK